MPHKVHKPGGALQEPRFLLIHGEGSPGRWDLITVDYADCGHYTALADAPTLDDVAFEPFRSDQGPIISASQWLCVAAVHNLHSTLKRSASV
jgi:hypothetical protein